MEKQKSFLALNFYDCMLLKEAGMYLILNLMPYS